MICRYGMSEHIGPVYLEENGGGEVFLGRDWMSRRSYGEEGRAYLRYLGQPVRRVLDIVLVSSLGAPRVG